MARTARELAMMRAVMQEESKALRDGRVNTSGEIGAAYPCMMYRRTDEEDINVISTHKDGSPREFTVRNSFGGLLCETEIAYDADEAEALTADGWDTSPQAAYGQVAGLASVTSAKDARIAELEAMLAAARPDDADEPMGGEARRGPGRPRKTLAPDMEPL